MSLPTLIMFSIGLAMDAFAVSICKGLALRKPKVKEMAICGIWFGGFQALMPVIGYFLGSLFQSYIVSIDHWIAFGLLTLIGGNMIKEAFDKEKEEMNSNLDIKTMFILAVATSIDALIVGITLAFLQVNIYLAGTIIGIITFAFSAVGVKLGSIIGEKFGKKAEFIGGLVLILIGLKTLLEHLQII